MNLLGIDSNTCPNATREKAWKRLALSLSEERLTGMSRTITLRDIPETAQEMLRGRVQGRIIVDVNA